MVKLKDDKRVTVSFMTDDRAIEIVNSMICGENSGENLEENRLALVIVVKKFEKDKERLEPNGR